MYLVKVLSIRIGAVGGGLIKCLLCSPDLASVDTTCLSGCLLLLVPNDPWNCLVTRHPGNLLLNLSSEDYHLHVTWSVLDTQSLSSHPDLSNQSLHFIKISKLVVRTFKFEKLCSENRLSWSLEPLDEHMNTPSVGPGVGL